MSNTGHKTRLRASGLYEAMAEIAVPPKSIRTGIIFKKSITPEYVETQKAVMDINFNGPRYANRHWLRRYSHESRNRGGISILSDTVNIAPVFKAPGVADGSESWPQTKPEETMIMPDGSVVYQEHENSTLDIDRYTAIVNAIHKAVLTHGIAQAPVERIHPPHP